MEKLNFIIEMYETYDDASGDDYMYGGYYGLEDIDIESARAIYNLLAGDLYY